MTDLANASDSNEIDEREQAFYDAGVMLGLTLAGRDLAEADELIAEPPNTDWAADIVAMGLMCTAVAYCVDISVDLGRDHLDVGQLGDYLSYLTHNSVVSGLSEHQVGFALTEDEDWAERTFDLLLSNHWDAVAALAELLLGDTHPSNDPVRDLLAKRSASHWLD